MSLPTTEAKKEARQKPGFFMRQTSMSA